MSRKIVGLLKEARGRSAHYEIALYFERFVGGAPPFSPLLTAWPRVYGRENTGALAHRILHHYRFFFQFFAISSFKNFLFLMKFLELVGKR